MPGQKPSKANKPEKVSSTILGAAAEHYVMCQLLRRDMIAALAPTGVPNCDIIVSDKLGSKVAAVQVKARRAIGADGGWHMKAKHETIFAPLLFYCFVDFGLGLSDAPQCWVIPSTEVAEAISQSHAVWLSSPGKKGQARNDTEMRRLMPDYSHQGLGRGKGWLDPYKEAWTLIKGAAAT